jgi:hypothetical protein
VVAIAVGLSVMVADRDVWPGLAVLMLGAACLVLGYVDEQRPRGEAD